VFLTLKKTTSRAALDLRSQIIFQNNKKTMLFNTKTDFFCLVLPDFQGIMLNLQVKKYNKINNIDLAFFMLN
jgi:hypothetical protein